MDNNIKKYVLPEITLDEGGFHLVTTSNSEVIEEPVPNQIQEASNEFSLPLVEESNEPEPPIDPKISNLEQPQIAVSTTAATPQSSPIKVKKVATEVVIPDDFIGPPLPPEQTNKLTILQEELDVMLQEKYQDGYREGYTIATNELNDVINIKLENQKAMLNTISIIVTDLEKQIDERLNRELTQFVYLSQIIAEKIASFELYEHHKEKIETAIETAILRLSRSTSFTIQTNPSNLELVNKVAEAMRSKKKGVFVEVVENQQISVYDCRIEWKNGFFSYSLKERMFDIDKIIAGIINK